MSLLLMAALVLAREHPGSSVHVEVAKVVLGKMVDDASPNLVLCLDIDGVDPLDEILAQLQRPGRIITKRSKCHKATDGGDHPSYYGRTHRPAHFLSVSNALQISRTELTVQAYESYHLKWASFWTVRLTHDDAGWHIVSFHLDAQA